MASAAAPGKELCEACSDIKKLTIAQVYCVKCDSRMCKKHEKQHKDLFSKHTNVISVADYVLQVQTITPRYCSSHRDQPLTLACEKCKYKFCTECEDLESLCGDGDQRRHAIINIRKLAAKLRNELLVLKSKSMATQASYQDFANEIIDDYDTETKTQIMTIHYALDEQIKDLTQGYKKLEVEFTAARQEKRDEVVKFVDTQVGGRLQELGDQMQLLDTTMHDLHEVDLIGNYAKRKSIIAKLIADPKPRETITKISLKPTGTGTKCEMKLRLCLDKADENSLASVPCRSEATFQYKIEDISRMKDQLLSPAHMVRNLPWKVLAMVRTQSQDRGSMKTLGFFLQCNAESDSISWSCKASAELRMLKQTDASGETDPFQRRIQHLFFSKENDWGFSNFLTWNDMTDPSNGYIKDDSIILEVFVTADAPHGVSWDSKKHTGYVGLKNQGATCYMNSLLQTLYFTNKLRKAVYQMPIEHSSDEESNSVALALQRVFYDLQFNDKPVATKRLTKSFGWETLDAFMQHDVQELCRVLLDNMESKMKDTCVDGTIPCLFEGKWVSYVKCKAVDYVSSREEKFYDIQLNIKGKKTLEESFGNYVAKEYLEGENKYDAGDHGLQEAEKGVIFTKFPPVLHLQLMRFQYDLITDANVKINDRFEFPDEIDLGKYLQNPEETAAIYRLHAVLVHSGDNLGGYHVGYIDPVGNKNWCKFDDDVVSKCTHKEATDRNFGGRDGISAKHSTNAYMLVYIRESALGDVLHPISQNDIPETLIERLEKEKRDEAQRKKDRSEAHLYMYINVVLEDVFQSHHGHDLFDTDKSMDALRKFKQKRADTVSQLLETLAEALNYKQGQIRIWPFQMRQNQTFRPTMLEIPVAEYGNKTVQEASDGEAPWYIFVETLPIGSPLEALPYFDRTGHVCLFIKRYDPKSETLAYCGHYCFPIIIVINDMMPILAEIARFPAGTKLAMYEEVKPNLIEKVEFTGGVLEKEMDELMDGDIIIVQKEESSLEGYKKPTPKEYSRELHYQVEVMFYDKNEPTDAGFTLDLSLRMNYNTIATQVAEHLGSVPYMLQFFRSHGYKEGPGNAIKCTFAGLLKDLVSANRSRSPRKLYYQKLSMPRTRK